MITTICDKCYWNFHGTCVSEDIDIQIDETQYTDLCIGFLDKDIETKMLDTYEQCMELLGKRNYRELLEIRSFIEQQHST